MRVAICFWGLNRSTKFTISSIRKQLFFILQRNKISFDVYLHTYAVEGLYFNRRAGEKPARLDNHQWKLIRPHFHRIESQKHVDSMLDLPKYRTMGCPWNSPEFQTLNNHIRSLYSLKQVTQMMLARNVPYQYVLFCRPDVIYKTPFSIHFFRGLNDHSIKLVDYAKFPVNDRFAICTPSVAKIYGLRFDKAYDYSLHKPLHSETYLANILKENKIQIQEIRFIFFRVRSDGRVQTDKID